MCASYFSLLQVDVYGNRHFTSVLEWMGKHSLSIFVLINSNLVVIAIQGFYWNSPENNIVSVKIHFTENTESPSLRRNQLPNHPLLKIQNKMTSYFISSTGSLDCNTRSALMIWVVKYSLSIGKIWLLFYTLRRPINRTGTKVHPLSPFVCIFWKFQLF